MGDKRLSAREAAAAAREVEDMILGAEPGSARGWRERALAMTPEQIMKAYPRARAFTISLRHRGFILYRKWCESQGITMRQHALDCIRKDLRERGWLEEDLRLLTHQPRRTVND